jgi:hypothetical protein
MGYTTSSLTFLFNIVSYIVLQKIKNWLPRKTFQKPPTHTQQKTTKLSTRVYLQYNETNMQPLVHLELYECSPLFCVSVCGFCWPFNLQDQLVNKLFLSQFNLRGIKSSACKDNLFLFFPIFCFVSLFLLARNPNLTAAVVHAVVQAASQFRSRPNP